MKTKSFLLFLGMLIFAASVYAQSWEFVNLRQFRVKDVEAFQKFVKHAYPHFNKGKLAPAVDRLAATSESGRVYTATYFANLDQYNTYAKEWANEWALYSKSPGNLVQEFTSNLDTGIDEVLWKLNKEMTVRPEGFDPTKNPWRKLLFITIKPGKEEEYLATWLKIKEMHKTLGISYAIFVFTVSHGAPGNTLFVSIPAENALAHYTATANRSKIVQGNPEFTALYKKLKSLASHVLIDQITTIPY